MRIISLKFFCVFIFFITPILGLAATSQNNLTPSSRETAFNELNNTAIAEILGWTVDENIPICNGSYIEPEEISLYPKPKPAGTAPVTVTATNPVFFSQYGESVISGNVKVNEEGREVTADEMRFTRDKTTGKLSTSNLFGSVHLREYGKLIVAKTGHWDFATKNITLNNTIYRMATPTLSGNLDAWGKSPQIVRNERGVIKLTNATYSTCPANNNSWKLWANKVDLDKNTGRGTAENSVLYLHSVPVLYFPYINFPIDKRRKSGFLYPSIGFTDGYFDTSLPYYFNLAPNYDLTVTPRYMSNRGLLTEGLFNYLTPTNNGHVDLYYIPHDTGFATFREDAETKYKPSRNLSQLENADNYRGLFSLQNLATYNQHWTSSLDVNYATDNYFLQDFGTSNVEKDDDQLLNQLDLKYSDENWNFLGRLQEFQTLNTVTQSSNAEYQYRKLPQLDLNGDFPEQKYGLDYQANAEFVNFDFDHKTNPNTGDLVPIGARANLQPGISLPYSFAGGYVTPGLQLQHTMYNLDNNVDEDNNPISNNITRTLPIFTVDSGLYLNRDVTFFSKGDHYIQTLEPRLYYLYVPKTNQDDIPLFDTSLSTFNYDQLFLNNRFSGLDRTGDANQISLGLTTRFLDGFSAEEKLRASIGAIYQFQRHQICITSDDCNDDPLVDNQVSPVVAELQYDMTKNWSATANAAWDTPEHNLNNGDFTIKYKDDDKHIASISYQYVKDGDTVADDPDNTNLQRINLATSWPVWERWNLLANWNYNISHSHPETYFYGVEYDNCCWAARLVASQTYIGLDENDSRTYDRAVYLQFLLKGLGSAGTSDAGSILTGQIPYYNDRFHS